jgi:hypothetical protein
MGPRWNDAKLEPLTLGALGLGHFRKVVRMTANADRASFPPAESSSQPGPEVFDRVFSLAAGSPGIARLWERAHPDLPPEVEPHWSSATMVTTPGWPSSRTRPGSSCLRPTWCGGSSSPRQRQEDQSPEV